MAAVTTNGDAAANVLDDIKPPAGIVLPPREIRNVLEKTAGYVARNGAVFEDRIREKERSNPKFSFLNPSDAYHPFYQWRLDEVKSGRGTAIAAGRVGEPAAEAPKPQGPPKPADYQFSARTPRINRKDLDVIQLSALFVAKNGRQFMTQLAQREAGNPQFGFLIPNHTLHNFFQHIIDQYTTLLRASGLGGEGGKLQEERIKELEANINDKFLVLNRAKQRAEYAKYVESERQKKEEEEVKAKEEFAMIDWGDFVVVETITFNEADEHANLPPPTNLSDLQYASLEDRNNASISASLRIEEAMPDEDTTYNAYPNQPAPYPIAPQQPAYQPAQMPPPVQPYSPVPQAQPQQPQRSAQEEEEERRIQERAEQQARKQQATAEARGGAPPMKIKENYVPRAAQKAANRQGAQTALCPNCKQQIPMNELEAHMRIELLDPRWKEQKAKADTRYASSNTIHVDVANNLKRLASQRSDVFDPVTGQAISEDELARRKKAAIHSYDGAMDAKSQAQLGHMQNVNVEDQIRAIHQKFADKK
ncbi:Pre-mRNA-splicing factor sap114 [Fusarium oxysporum f. sp. cubense]|uniref:Pre-mRNA-splicing factor sap114 n=1 Tax=Fusarium oxysporum f. sp. cubense TaxID=61366 RepID=A0A559KRI4_FUSOC|nr:Pre-mRNA-splicing factor sap114 [Fusarium oxysporum f. sp. cubense]